MSVKDARPEEFTGTCQSGLEVSRREWEGAKGVRAKATVRGVDEGCVPAFAVEGAEGEGEGAGK